jgi:hypothetical protein
LFRVVSKFTIRLTLAFAGVQKVFQENFFLDKQLLKKLRDLFKIGADVVSWFVTNKQICGEPLWLSGKVVKNEKIN